MSRPAGVFQESAFFSIQREKKRSHCRSAAIPSASRYQRSCPSYWPSARYATALPSLLMRGISCTPALRVSCVACCSAADGGARMSSAYAARAEIIRSPAAPIPINRPRDAPWRPASRAHPVQHARSPVAPAHACANIESRAMACLKRPKARVTSLVVRLVWKKRPCKYRSYACGSRVAVALSFALAARSGLP
jgi:hypothetical protein